jgi:hypothetical protein
MKFYIPNTVLSQVFQSFKTTLKAEPDSAMPNHDFLLRQGMLEGINLVESRVNTWILHQKNRAKLAISGESRLITKEITLSKGHYRKFEWYEGIRFFSLAFRWGKDQPSPEIALQVQNTNTLDNEYFIYVGTLKYNTLVSKARSGGIRGVKNSKTKQEWNVST